MSVGSEEGELSVGPGMAPIVQEKMRRKSVSSKAAEVVTIGESSGCRPQRTMPMIRPDSTRLGEEAERRQGSCGSTCFKKDRHATGR